jgi:phosphoglycerol transferase
MSAASDQLSRRQRVGGRFSGAKVAHQTREALLTHRADIVGGLLAVIGSLAAVTFSMQLWNAHLHLPLAYGSDGIAAQTVVKNLISGGWVWTNHSLGAPFGQQFYDYPIATDDLNYLTIKVIGFFFADSARAMNVFFLFTFVTAGLCSYVVFRWLRLSIPTSIVCAVLFADAPYHLFRGEVHLMLSSYWSVPMGVYLILSVLDGRTMFTQRREGFGVLRRWLTRRNLFLVIVCVAIGSLGVYYAVFTALLLGAAGLAIAVRSRGWAALVQAVVLCGVIGAATFANDLPSPIYRHQHGTDAIVAHRLPSESEIYALKFVEMVFPVPGHRVPALDQLRAKYDSTAPVLSEGAEESLGIVASLGLIWLLAVVLGAVAGVGGDAPWLRRHRQLGFAAMMAFLLGTLGGISAVIGYLISSEIRGWDRISIVIAFFALCAVGLGIDALRRRMGERRRLLWLAAVGVLALVGVYDASSRDVVPPYQTLASSYGADAAFVDQIQTQVPHDAMIYQLPYVAYPENGPTFEMLDYDQMRGDVHTTTGLRWSYGAIKGRPQDWAASSDGLPARTLVDGLVAAGFSGIWIDRYGYADGGTAVRSGIQAVLDAPPIVSRDQRHWFFSLVPYATRFKSRQSAQTLAGLSQALLYPPAVVWGDGFYADEGFGSRWAESTATAAVSNTSDAATRLVMVAAISTRASDRNYPLTITLPDGTVHHLTINSKPKKIALSFTNPPGEHTITFQSTAPIVPAPNDTRSLAVRYEGLDISDAGIAPFLDTRTG